MKEERKEEEGKGREGSERNRREERKRIKVGEKKRREGGRGGQEDTPLSYCLAINSPHLLGQYLDWVHGF